jgi:hypothetical protein
VQTAIPVLGRGEGNRIDRGFRHALGQRGIAAGAANIEHQVEPGPQRQHHDDNSQPDTPGVEHRQNGPKK